MPHKVTLSTLPLVMAKLTLYALNEPKESRQAFCNDLDLFLNELVEQDAFGTEGQCDPRGDQRN